MTQISDQMHFFNSFFHFFKCTREFAFDGKSWCIATSWLNFQKSSLCQKFYSIFESYSWFRWCYSVNLLLSCLLPLMTRFLAACSKKVCTFPIFFDVSDEPSWRPISLSFSDSFEFDECTPTIQRSARTSLENDPKQQKK